MSQCAFADKKYRGYPQLLFGTYCITQIVAFVRCCPKYIIHAVVPRWVDGEHDEYDLLSSAYLASLNIAEIMRCDSIAFPLLASGNNGFDKELAIQIAKESIGQFTGDSLKNVYLGNL